MRIAIVGYGRMGREAARVAAAAGHEIVARVDPVAADADAARLTPEIAAGADVAIEFSIAEAVVDNARGYAAAGLNAAVGTTGWGARLEEVRAIIEGGCSGYLHATNFSLGVQLFLRLAGQATALMEPFPDYDAAVFERHHRRKADSPSGTALTLAAAVLASSTRKRRVATERLDRPIEADELHVASVRGGEEPGTHVLLFDSLDDTIELTHRARGRAALAAGALQVATWLAAEPRKSGFFGIDDFIDEMLAKESTHEV
jgi:4-hydroxy-tetrahydrodipicolinate reductase